jgi:hypothetical protein
MKDRPKEHPGPILRRFQRHLRKNGIDSHVHVFVDDIARNHIRIEAVRIKIALTVTVAEDGQLEIASPGQRYRATPDNAISIIADLAKKGNA